MKFLVRRYNSDLYAEPDSRGEALFLAYEQHECAECGDFLSGATDRAILITVASNDISTRYFSAFCLKCAPLVTLRVRVANEMVGIA